MGTPNKNNDRRRRHKEAITAKRKAKEAKKAVTRKYQEWLDLPPDQWTDARKRHNGIPTEKDLPIKGTFDYPSEAEEEALRIKEVLDSAAAIDKKEQ